MEHSGGMMAAGAQVEMEEMLPEMIDPNSFLLQNVCFSQPGFCLVAPQTGAAAAVWVRGHHQEGHQLISATRHGDDLLGHCI